MNQSRKWIDQKLEPYVFQFCLGNVKLRCHDLAWELWYLVYETTQFWIRTAGSHETYACYANHHYYDAIILKEKTYFLFTFFFKMREDEV